MQFIIFAYAEWSLKLSEKDTIIPWEYPGAKPSSSLFLFQNACLSHLENAELEHIANRQDSPLQHGYKKHYWEPTSLSHWPCLHFACSLSFIAPGPQWPHCCGHLNGYEKMIQGQQHLFSLVYQMATNTGWKECDPFHHSVTTTFKRKSHPFRICTPDISRKLKFHSLQGALIFIHVLFKPCLQLPFPHQLPHNLHTQPAGWFPPHTATSLYHLS